MPNDCNQGEPGAVGWPPRPSPFLDELNHSSRWEGEGPRGYPAEPHSLARADKRLRFGGVPPGSLTLP